MDNAKLDQKFGTFPTLPAGSTLRTEDGRVELLLTSGCVLRLDHNSSVRLASNSLTDTKVEFLKGAAILDSSDAEAAKNILLKVGDKEVRFSQAGVYRVDAEPATLQVYSGEAQVTAATKKVAIDSNHMYFFDVALDTPKYEIGTEDEFYQWAHDRSETILADNRIANGIKDAGSDPNTDTDSNSDDDELSLLNPGLGSGAVPGYADPDASSPLIGPLPQMGSPGLNPSLRYANPLYGASGLYGAVGGFGLLPYQVMPLYILPRPSRGGFSTAAAEAQYWHQRILMIQQMQNRMWQYRASHWPGSSVGVTRTYPSGLSTFSPAHSFGPHPMPRPITPVVPHPAISPGAHPMGHAMAGHR